MVPTSELPSCMYPELSSVTLFLKICVSPKDQLPMLPAFAVIVPLAASNVTEFDPFATLSPVELRANPFPVNVPAVLIVPL